MAKDSKNFKEKTRRLFLKYAFIPVLVLFLLFFLFMILTSRLMVVNNAGKAGNLVKESFSGVYENYYREIQRMAKNDIVINFFETHKNSNLVYEEFYNFNNNQKVKSSFHIVNKDGVLLASTTPSDPYVDDVILRKIIPRIEKRPKEVLTEANEVKYPHERFTVYTFGKAIYKDSKVIGYIIYQLYEEDMQNLIFVRDTEVVVITDQYDRIIVATSNIIRGLMNKFAPQYVNSEKHVKIKDGVYYMDKKTLPMAPINIYTLAPMSYNGPMFIFYGGFILLVSLFLYYLMNYLADKMSIQNSAAIDKLLHGVYELQKGNMRSYVDINTGDEFEILANQYNIMLDRLNELANRNKELSDIRRIKEIKQLQAQFNPHFIFNILETLRYTIVIDPKQAQDIVMTLSNLLRYSIGNDGQDVLVKDDLEYIEDYLRLHKIRFNERLTYNIDVPEEVKNAYVPKLLLQAIIENSIKYGYKEKEFLTINVTGDIVNGHIVLEVKDNGTGMTKEQLIRVKDMLQKPQNKTKHIGLYNVHRRLVLLYGEEYGLNIKSSYEKGTYVSILIPYGKDGNNV